MRKNFKTHDLERWLTFLTHSVEQEELEEIVAMDENISKVYEEIKHLLSDEEILAVAEAREKQFLDYNSAINHATRRGIETGKLAIAKKMLTSFSDEEIVELTELDIDVIKELRREIK